MSFIIMAFYCYGAGMMDYFAIYEPWQLINEKDFTALHHFQGDRIVAIFVIPSAIMTLLNLATALFPLPGTPRKLLWLALIAYSFDWIFSFTMQIPIQLQLGEGKDMDLLNDLLRTNWWRFAADTVHIIIVSVIVWKYIFAQSREVAKAL
ncbi:MAG: hypothetical protein H7Y31_12505 [Chitinophagaceae bacterium]|nr:hypothetical protein [Chitinophagaceae bacterium]